MPDSVRNLFNEGFNGKILETPKPNDEFFKNVTNLIIASNKISREAISIKANKMGFTVLNLVSQLQGLAKEMGKSIADSFDSFPNDAIIIAGGETTVNIKGTGVGGRNQELVLASCELLSKKDFVIIAAIGTDGIDGPTDAAGAIADNLSFKKAVNKGMIANDYLENNDSYSYLKKTEGLIYTGRTGTNVMDFVVAVKMNDKK